MLQLKNLSLDDYSKGYLELLSQLTIVGEMSKERFEEIFLKNKNEIYVVEDLEKNKIIGTASLFIEQKFIHGGGKVGHLEDVVVDVGYRGKNIGGMLVSRVVEKAKEEGCYKLIGDCKDELVGFYGKLGMERRGCQIGIYF